MEVKLSPIFDPFSCTINVTSDVWGGAAAVWRALGANLTDATEQDRDLLTLKLAVCLLIGTGRSIELPGLIKNVRDGRIALLRYSKWVEETESGPRLSFHSRSIEYPPQQERAEEMHAVQRELTAAGIECDFENCRLDASKRKVLRDSYDRFMDAGLRKIISPEKIRERASLIVEMINPRPNGPRAAG